jgi:hypothetical protein
MCILRAQTCADRSYGVRSCDECNSHPTITRPEAERGRFGTNLANGQLSWSGPISVRQQPHIQRLHAFRAASSVDRACSIAHANTLQSRSDPKHQYHCGVIDCIGKDRNFLCAVEHGETGDDPQSLVVSRHRAGYDVSQTIVLVPVPTDRSLGPYTAPLYLGIEAAYLETARLPVTRCTHKQSGKYMDKRMLDARCLRTSLHVVWTPLAHRTWAVPHVASRLKSR